MKFHTLTWAALSFALAILLGLAPSVAQSQEEDPGAAEPETETQGPEAGASEDVESKADEDKRKKDLAKFTDELTVTATRVETDLMDTPVAVSAYSGW